MFNSNNLRLALLSTVSAVIATGSAQAQTSADETQEGQQRGGGIEEIVVTAERTEQTLQEAAVAVQALGAEALEQQRISSFSDYLQALPNVTAGGSGPGQRTIYIRGLASTTPNLTVAGVAGLAPNVAFYLDEQPLAQPGRNLDVYTTDLERIEVLAGPQGTLFGASSQAGTVRLITNKPDPTRFEAKANFSTSFTQGGEMSNKVEAIINVPLKDNLAVRGVVYADSQGGYIDNVSGSRSLADNVPNTQGFDASEPYDGGARFRPVGTVRDNGLPVAPRRGGFQAGADLTDVEFREATNDDLVEEDFNDAVYTGFRVSALYEPLRNVSITLAHTQQSLEAEGVFFVDPELDDLEIQRFERDELTDDFSNTAWTVEGRFDFLNIIYTGAFTDRDTDQRIDYSDYIFVGQYIPYYICDTSVVYPSYTGNDSPTGVCQEPNLAVVSNSNTTVLTQELRFSTPDDFAIGSLPFRAQAGVFYSDLELEERNDFTYFGSTDVRGADGVTRGFVPNFPLTNAAATPGDVGNESQGYFSDPGPFPEGVIFRNDVLRTDEKLGIFGEATLDIWPETVAITFGARYYDIEVDLAGSANSSFFNLNSAIFGPNAGRTPAEARDAQLGGTNISAQYADDNAEGVPSVAATDGVIIKARLSWTPTPDYLFYALYSEGFRPGLLNRPGGAQGPGDFTVPFELDTDEVDNIELGWKLDFFANSLRFNGNAFFVDVSGLQTTIFDPGITNLFFSDNAADAEIYGVEGDITWAPRFIDGLFVNGAFSFLETEITEVLTPTDDVIEGEELAYAPSFQGNLRARYEFSVASGYLAHVAGNVTYTGEQRTDIIEINAIDLDDWVTFGLSAGVETDRWSAEIFADNLSDERAEVSGDFVFDRRRVTVVRPRTFGVRVGLTY